MTSAVPLNGETWVLVGNRHFKDQAVFDGAMRSFMERYGCPSRIVHGAHTRTDDMADALGRRLGVEVVRCPVSSEEYGWETGRMRNRLMLSYSPQKVIAFHRSRSGTPDIAQRARRAGIFFIEVVAPDRRKNPRKNPVPL